MSVLGWVDFGEANRQDMDRLLDAFRDESTVDELGIGTIRDAFAEMLFPGTSTLHTRARYLLLVAWLASSVAAERHHLERALHDMRQREVRLIEALLAGDEGEGVIGRDARAALKRMPSEVYWGAIGRYGIRRCAEGMQHHFRAVAETPVHRAEEDEEANHGHTDPHFVQLPASPSDLLNETNFTLTSEEADFLSERIQVTCRGTYLAWLVKHRTPGDADSAWDPGLSHDLDDGPGRTLGHAQRLHDLYQGAPLLYNLLLARKCDWQEKAAGYENELRDWARSDGVAEAVERWDGDDFWLCLHHGGARIKVRTRDFIDRWVRLVQDNPASVLDGDAAGRLVEHRERRLKGSRSRFANPDALRSWSGTSGVGGLHYRWVNARTLVNDIRKGQGAPDA